MPNSVTVTSSVNSAIVSSSVNSVTVETVPIENVYIFLTPRQADESIGVKST